jgi:ABC-type multidrug transport system fused ATPase/permease subunit
MINGVIEIKDVEFNYPSKKDVQVLKGVSIQVDNNKKRVVALVGSSGCGKSSIISLIERFYDPNQGAVLFNGRDIRSLDPRWYHQ